MLEQEIATLVARDHADLSTLEADVWRREAKLRAARRANRTLVSLQALVVVLSTVSSAAIGMTAATGQVQAHQGSFFNPGAELAPSSLLFGNHR